MHRHGPVRARIALALVTLVFLGPVDWVSDRLLGDRIVEEHIIRVLTTDVATLSRIQDIIQAHGAKAQGVKLVQLGDAIGIRIVLQCRRQTALDIIDRMENLDGVAFVFDQ